MVRQGNKSLFLAREGSRLFLVYQNVGTFPTLGCASLHICMSLVALKYEKRTNPTHPDIEVQTGPMLKFHMIHIYISELAFHLQGSRLYQQVNGIAWCSGATGDSKRTIRLEEIEDSGQYEQRHKYESTSVRLTLSLPRVVNFKFPLQLTRNITLYEKLGFSCS